MKMKMIGKESQLQKKAIFGIAFAVLVGLLCLRSFNSLAESYFAKDASSTNKSSLKRTLLPLDNSNNFNFNYAKKELKHNMCIAVIGYTLGNLSSAPSNEMLSIMRTYASTYKGSTFFMLDSMGGDSNETAAELCRTGGFPSEQCIYMGDLDCDVPPSKSRSCLSMKLVRVYDTLRDTILANCRYFIRADSDEYLYLPAMERWLKDFPSVDDEPFVFGQVRGSKYAGRISYSFPGGSSLFNRPLIEKVFGGYEWRVALKSLNQSGIFPTMDDAFSGYVLGYCNPEKEVMYRISPGDVIMGGANATSKNLERWRNLKDSRHCAWKIHKVDIMDYDELHSYYRNHTLQYNASTEEPTFCKMRAYENIPAMASGVEDRACNDTRVAVNCRDYIDQDKYPPNILNENCTTTSSE